ncbi:MAG: type I restriction enzyme HsdR N-terminal domain-containing protein [Crocinitomicaceae bacterium]|nr:type I restriction enzyme HsdR N-terminal domain-containing protein [Crocinitomicaceae bacterium]
MITPLNLPKAELKLTRKNDEVYVRCLIRQKDLVCTPEEWVRQHIINFLINEKGVSKGRIASEYPLEYNGRSKRADLVLFDEFGKPIMIVECKAPEVSITEKVVHQIAQYNSQLNVDRLFLTNGLTHIFCEIDREKGQLVYHKDWPNW